MSPEAQAAAARLERSVTRRVLLERFPALKERTLKEWIQGAQERELVRHGQRTTLPGNGLAPALTRVGRETLIDVEAFVLWWDSHRVR